MKPRGPSRKPSALKRLQGTWRADRVPENEPNPEPAIPACPDELSDEAKKEWVRVSAELVSMRLLSEMDRAALAGYCQAWATWIEAQASLREYGVIIRSPNGFPMPSPYLSVANKAFEQMRMMLAEFGMSPSSRARVQALPPPLADDPLARFLRDRGRST